MAFRSLLVFLAFMAVLTRAPAQSSYEQITAKFFDLYKIQGGSDKAVDYIFSTNKYATSIGSQLDTLKSKLNYYISNEGQYYGYELVAKKSAGPNFILLTYLIRHDRNPMTFRFIFYKPGDKWQLQTFNFNDGMDDELQDASKASRFKENSGN